MIPIFICEDDAKQQIEIEDIVKNYVEDYELDEDFKVELVTEDPYDILNHIEENTVNGLYFLDIHLETDITGIELAAKIRKYDKRAALVFITSDSESLGLTFRYAVEAMGYIEKGDSEMKEEIENCIRLAKERLVDDTTKSFIFKSDRNYISERYADIMFFGIDKEVPNRIEIFGKNGVNNFWGSLAKIEKQLEGESFHRLTGSLLINLDNVKEISQKTNEVTMVNGMILKAHKRKIAGLVKVRTKKGGGIKF